MLFSLDMKKKHLKLKKDIKGTYIYFTVMNCCSKFQISQLLKRQARLLLDVYAVGKSVDAMKISVTGCQ